jgi:uracil-DNA glycosylase
MQDVAARLDELSNEVVTCQLCPRLADFRRTVPKRASFSSQEYWRKPIPSFGDPDAWLMLIGLAPAAHGGNRTGRLFTGDESAAFLMRALHSAGFANQPTSLSADDGLRLEGCYISAAVRCAPPDNKPTPAEFRNCRQYLDREIELMPNLRCVVALGQLAFKSYLDLARSMGFDGRGVKFRHGNCIRIPGLPWLYASYHPSPRNTYTGKLTQSMFLEVLESARRHRGV